LEEEGAGREPKAELNSEEPLDGDGGTQPNGGNVEVLDALAWTGACIGPKGENKLAGVAPKISVLVEEEATGEIPTSGLAKATLFPNGEPKAGLPQLCAGPKLGDGEFLDALAWKGKPVISNLGVEPNILRPKACVGWPKAWVGPQAGVGAELTDVTAGANPSSEELWNGDEVEDEEVADALDDVANLSNHNLGDEAGDCAGPELTDVMAAGADPKLNGEELWSGDEVEDVEVADAPEPEVARRMRGSPNVGDGAGPELTGVMAAWADPKLNGEEKIWTGDDVEVETVAPESCPRAWTGDDVEVETTAAESSSRGGTGPSLTGTEVMDEPITLLCSDSGVLSRSGLVNW